jgi:hypothetical protein
MAAKALCVNCPKIFVEGMILVEASVTPFRFTAKKVLFLEYASYILLL